MAIDAARTQRLKEMSLDILLRNRRQTDGHQYTVPSPESYPFQWLWDSCFHAIALSHFSTEDAKQEIRSLFSAQFENGMLPHMIYRGDKKEMKLGEDFVSIDWGRASTSTITQPPLIAEAVWNIFERDGDSAFLRETYQPLCAFFDYLLSARDPRGNHLSGIINPDESGEDNSPRFDGVLGLPPVQTLQENFASRLKLVEELRAGHFDAPCMKQFFWVKDVPFNAMLARNLEILADIAGQLEMLDDVQKYADESGLVSRAMRERMFDGNFFWPTYGESYMKIKLKTWAIFAPMYAGLLSDAECKHLVDEHLLNAEEFHSRFMVPTVSKSEETYDPEGFWRGSTWIGINWFVCKGLRRYGYRDLAEKIVESSVELLEQSGFREYYHPDTGAGLGAHDFTWGALIVDMLADRS